MSQSLVVFHLASFFGDGCGAARAGGHDFYSSFSYLCSNGVFFSCANAPSQNVHPPFARVNLAHCFVDHVWLGDETLFVGGISVSNFLDEWRPQDTTVKC